MSRRNYYQFNEKNESIIMTFNSGFFSTLSVRLHAIVKYYNIFKILPKNIDDTISLHRYKLLQHNGSNIGREFFNPCNIENQNKTFRAINYREGFQFSNYKKIDYPSITPLINQYFSPTEEIINSTNLLQEKYTITYDNTCVLFYRGLDKKTEFILPSYDKVFTQARIILEKNPNIRFLIQSDELEFIEAALCEFPGSIVFRDETRSATINNTTGTLEMIFRKDNNNLYYSKMFLSIMLLMSKCKWVICNTGNCSIWITLFRGNSVNVFQYVYDMYI
jgi:hypothetical protein